MECHFDGRMSGHTLGVVHYCLVMIQMLAMCREFLL